MRVHELAFDATSDIDVSSTGVRTFAYDDFGAHGFKNVAARLPWASAVVLFGQNDVGKSNILEAVRTPDLPAVAHQQTGRKASQATTK